jgi:peptidoglycan/LPS O-acetylase OafA/YrhL
VGIPAAVASPDALEAQAPHLQYQPALDGLRALAVLAVIAYHDNSSWARGGFLGVDAFFVLSGFLITTLLVLEYRRHAGVGLVGFWGRRARRLLPALLLVLLFVTWYTQHFVTPWERASVRDDGIASLFYVANWRFILDKQSYFTLFSAASPLRHTWSLAIEEQFYLVWPLVVLACLRLARGSTRLLAIVCAVGAGLSIVLMSVAYQAGDPSRAYYGTDTRAHALLIGALLALLLLIEHPPRRLRACFVVAAPVALVAMLLAFHRVSDVDPAYYHGGSAVFAVIVAVVIAGAMFAGPARRVLAIPGLPWIGRLSYGLYLWHWPIIVWIVPTRVHVGTTALNLIRLGLTFLFAITSYYLVELPVRRRWGRLTRHFVWVAPVAIVVTAVALLGSDAGATPPPSYIWGMGDPLKCGTPRPEEARAARAEDRARGPLRLPARVRDQRILLIGDSTACSLWTGLREVGPAHGVAVWQGSVFGCGIASGQITTTRNEQITPHSERCPELVDETLRPALARARPTLVLWMSSWEKSDIIEDGTTLVSGTRRGDAAMLSRMDDALRTITRGGAKVALVTVAAPAPNDAQGTTNSSNAIDDASYVRLRSIDERFAARHRDRVVVVDLAKRLCPHGPPCPELVRGHRDRPDGRHFDPAAAAHYSRWILRQLAPLRP